MTLRFDEGTFCHLAMDHEAPFLASVFRLQPAWRTTMWPVEASQQWRIEVQWRIAVGEWLEIAHTVENPPEDAR